MIFEGRKYFIVDLFEDNEKEGARILKDAIKTAISKKSSSFDIFAKNSETGTISDKKRKQFIYSSHYKTRAIKK